MAQAGAAAARGDEPVPPPASPQHTGTKRATLEQRTLARPAPQCAGQPDAGSAVSSGGPSQRLLWGLAGRSLVRPRRFAAAPAPTLHRDKQQKASHSPGCSPEINGGSYLWRHVCNGPMNFMEMRCCGGVRYWVLPLLLLKLRPLKSHPSAAFQCGHWDETETRGQSRSRGRAGQRGLRHRRAGSGTAARPRHEGLSTVRFYSPHTPLLKCKKRKNLNRVLFALKTLSMICELSQPW